MRTYKLRAECNYDAMALMILMAGVTIAQTALCDVNVTVKTDLTTRQLRAVIRSIDNSHVMLQTCELARNYTGNRKYKRD